MMRRFAILLCLAAMSCGNNGDAKDGSTADLAVALDLAPTPGCGHPGDTGNDKGVGKYCQSSSDCAAPAAFCTADVSKGHICTIINCDPTKDPVSECGDEGAMCRCSMLGCGCVPGRCVQPGMSG
jgi:hypothetical protein